MTLQCRVIDQGKLTFSRPNRLGVTYALSPFVWPVADGYRLLLRAVPKRDDEPRLKMSEIWAGRSAEGLDFEMDSYPCLFPSPQASDMDGCEDPTVWPGEDGLHVWYTGYDAHAQVGRLLHAREWGAGDMVKTGVAVDNRRPFLSPKEASIAPLPDGGWRLFFEYMEEGVSTIGQGRAASLDGPWEALSPAALTSREESWDGGHMSPGPIAGLGGDRLVMFYNGGTEDASWRIGWAVFDRDLTRVVARCDEPLIAPPPGDGPHASDIAFAASCVPIPGGVRLYYTVSDMIMYWADVEMDGS